MSAMNPKPYRVLFVCLGNICRSPAAEEVLRVRAAAFAPTMPLEIDSAGTYSGHRGELPDPRMRRCGQARGYCMTHRARPLQVRDFSLFDAILVMDDNNYDTVCRMAPDAEAREKVLRTADFLTGEYATKSTIPDPYYGDMADFEYVLDLLENATDEFLRRLTTCS